MYSQFSHRQKWLHYSAFVLDYSAFVFCASNKPSILNYWGKKNSC